MRQKNCKEYQAKPIKGATLQAIVERYNSFVDSGKDRAREFRNLSGKNWQARKRVSPNTVHFMILI